MPKAVTHATTSSASPGSYESTHVHNIYDAIAPHFSSTRYKPWPVVAAFLATIPPGSVGLDAGTGNGKYLIAPSEREGAYWTVGLDRSARLLDIAKRAGDKDRECVFGDVLNKCWREGAFDYALSIATIHHLSTYERRKKAVQTLLHCLSPSRGRALIYVWATQQDTLSKRALPTEPPAAKTGQGQDVFVPWVLSDGSTSCKAKQRSSPTMDDAKDSDDTASVSSPLYNRFYHMFDEGELRSLVQTAAEEMGICIHPPRAEESVPKEVSTPSNARRRFIEFVKDGWERSNYYVEFRLYEL
ncbi:hypothetical protein M0805_003098 [Coniferiporia weirii]|nr:hypothetical protein M0805_003098 [Coniferiporia weirii]